MTKYIKEPINSLTHLSGAILSIVGLVFMLYKSIINHSPFQIVSAIIFGVSLILLYSASTVYHWVFSSEKLYTILRKIDHSMIYILIAGTYTPICLNTIRGPIGYTLLAIIWGLALVGIVMKFFWLNAPRWLYTLFYLILGWMAIFFIVPIYKSIALPGFILLLAGGIFYTVGATVYATKLPFLKTKHLGFHEIFHIFIILGSVSHFLMINGYVLV
jgi:hemolysin III